MRAIKPSAWTPPEPLVIWGRMNESIRHLSKQLRHVPNATHDYHGTLRVMLSAANTLTRDVEQLLALLEGAEAMEPVEIVKKPATVQFQTAKSEQLASATEDGVDGVDSPVKIRGLILSAITGIPLRISGVRKALRLPYPPSMESVERDLKILAREGRAIFDEENELWSAK